MQTTQKKTKHTTQQQRNKNKVSALCCPATLGHGHTLDCGDKLNGTPLESTDCFFLFPAGINRK